jgi:polyisoprenoid-binding protein YceI
MTRTLIVALAAALFGAIVGIFGFTWVVGGSGEASATITAPTLDVNALPTLNPTEVAAMVNQLAELNAEKANLQATIDAMSAQNAVETTEVPAEAEAVEATEETAADTSDTSITRNLYRIDSTTSQATFILQEDLRGVRTDVVGITNEVAGDIIIDFANPAASQVGTIRINARTLETPESMRNRMIRSEILRSAQDEYEFIEFVPTAINGLPETVEVGESYTFDIVGNLTIIGNTREVTFTTTVNVNSEAQITGTATATVLYSDWGITIPSVSHVANVTDTVNLTINFTANQVVD